MSRPQAVSNITHGLCDYASTTCEHSKRSPASCIAHRLARQTGDTALIAAATTYYADARAAGRGTTRLNTLAAPADSGAAPELPDLDRLNEQTMTGVLANAARLAKPAVFDTETQRAPRRPLGQTPQALPGRPRRPRPTRRRRAHRRRRQQRRRPGRHLDLRHHDLSRLGSDAEPDGELGADDVRQAGGHLRVTATKRAEAAPGNSTALLMTRKPVYTPARTPSPKATCT